MVKSSIGNNEKFAFVISPVGDPGSDIRKRADQILKHVIEPSVKECGYTSLRADKMSQPGVITSQIIDHLLTDPLVIADLTGHNPNVFYELAVRHAIRKPVIQIIRKGERIPFDVSTTRTIEIDHQDLDSVDEARKEMIRQIQAAEKDPAKVDSPISMAVDLQGLRQSADPQRKALADIRTTLQGLYSSMSEIRESLSMMRMEQREAAHKASVLAERRPPYRIREDDKEIERTLSRYLKEKYEKKKGARLLNRR